MPTLRYALWSASHLPAQLFKSMTGVNIVNVNYKGVGPATNARVAGEIQLKFASAALSLRRRSR